MLNKFKDKLSTHVLGTFSKTLDPQIVEAIGYSGLDFIILDDEHGNAMNNLSNLIRAAAYSNIFPIVRVSELNSNHISSALDLGALGIQVPNIETVDQVRKSVEYSKFHPLGKRGVCRFVRAAQYGGMDRKEYFNSSNETLLIVQIEGKEGIGSLDEILEVPGYDIVFIGPYDLSQSLGVPGEVHSKIVQDEIRKVVSKASEKGIKLGTFCDTIDSANLMKRLGVHYIAYTVEVSMIQDAYKDLIKKIMNK